MHGPPRAIAWMPTGICALHNDPLSCPAARAAWVFSFPLNLHAMAKTSLDKSKIKFLLLEGIHPSAVEVLRSAGYTQVEVMAGALEGEELRRKIADVHFIGIRSRTQLTADVFAHAHKLKQRSSGGTP